MIEQLNDILSSGTDTQLIGFFFCVFTAFIVFAFMTTFFCQVLYDLVDYVLKKIYKRSNKE